MPLTRNLVNPLTAAISRGVTDGGKVWTPAALFANGEQGVFGVVHPNYLRQNSNGTTAVAVGDPVGYAMDLSGRSNNAIQATAGSRMILRQDAQGRYYLESDGGDDALLTGAFAPTNGSGEQSAFCAALVTNVVGNKSLIDSDQSGGTRISQTLRVSAAVAQTIVLDVTNTARQSDGGNVTANAAFVAGMVTTAASATGYLNGVAGTPIARTTPQTGTLGVAIGNRWSGGQPLAGRIYGFLQIARAVTAAERDLVTRWMANQAGVAV
jgi:hypothetical protein